MQAARVGVRTRGPVVGALALGTPLLVGIMLVLNVFGIVGGAIESVYMVGLVLYLFVAGFAFSLIMLSFLAAAEHGSQ